MSEAIDVVVVGGGIAGSALAATLARGGLAVAVLERDVEPVDRVRGEFVMPWGVIELKNLGLLDTLLNAGGLFGERSLSYEESTPGDAASPHVLRFADVVPEVPGGLCMGHPAMCRALGGAARQAGVSVLTGVEGVEVTAGTPPRIAFSH